MLYDPSDPRPALPPRFSLARGAGRGLVACLWLCASVGSVRAASPDAAPSPYRQALESFRQQEYGRALSQTEHVPENAGNGERADLFNLRGAIYLRLGRFDQARGAFAEAARLDPKLWAARFNEAEVSFRQKRYTASSEQFDLLLDHTSGFWHPQEHRFLEYKMLLAELCAGREQPALDFIAEHRADPAPPLAWYYLNAAVEQRHERPQKSDEWIAQAEAKYPAGNGETYAESFVRLGWLGGRSGTDERTMVAANHRIGRRVPDEDAPGLARASALHPRAGRETAEEASVRPSAPATLAVVQLMPERGSGLDPKDQGSVPDPKDQPALREEGNGSVPGFRLGMPPSSTEDLPAADLPPTGPGLLPATGSNVRAADGSPVAGALAKPRRPRSTPTPTPEATPAPSATPDTQSGGAAPSASPTPTPEASPAAMPSDQFTEKYEAAYLAFRDKDYPKTISLLDEAEKIQPNQPQALTLRKQVFKQEYEGAYLAFRKGDYPGALTQLDAADLAQPNYPDALNLRGLVYSKQHVYDEAESMFKKAVAADPTLWAAKFNYAELPFNRGDYTTARGRFEDLLGETDKEKLPREYELSEYKVFLTLLMEGKTDQARAFMDHFNFSGKTPAKYFCNAAMQFRAGSTEKAMSWINSAKGEYPAQLVTIFVESFYRLGWMTDPNGPAPGGGAAGASLAGRPGVEAVAPGVTAAPGGSPVLAGPGNATSVSPVTASPVLLATSSPASAGVPVAATPAPTLAVAPAAATPGGSPLATASASPTAAPTAIPVPTASAVEPAQGTTAKAFTADDALRLAIIVGVLSYGLYVFSRLVSSRRRKARRKRTNRLSAAGVGEPEHETAEIETPR